MRKRVQAASLCIGIIVASMGLIFVYQIAVPQHTLEWGVEAMNDYVYDVMVLGYYDNSEVPYVVLNNTRIMFRIMDLPDIPRKLNLQSFVEAIVGVVKTDCWFENGTEIPQTMRDGLNGLISRCILPVGDFVFIESLTNGTFGLNGYLSEIHEESFYFGFYSFVVDLGYSWGTNVTLDEGIPTKANLWNLSLHPPHEWFDYEVVLTAVSS